MEEGGGHGFLSTIVGYAMRGSQEKNTPNNGGGKGASNNYKEKNLKSS